MSNTTATPAFLVRTYDNHGWTMTEITVSSVDVETIEKKIDGCVDNKVGYQSAAIAAQQERKFRAIAAAGHTHVYSTHTYGLRLTLRWQHYTRPSGERDGYCDPVFEDLGRDFAGVERGVKFLRKLGARVEKMRAATSGGDARSVSNVSFYSPERVIEALRVMKCAQIEFNRELDETLAVPPAEVAANAA
jgi:hypothetical protein